MKFVRSMLRFGWPVASLTIATILSLPVIVLLASLFFDAESDWQHLVDNVLREYITNTVMLAVGVTLISLLVGVSCAWVVSSCRFPGALFFSWGLLLPLAIPTYLIAYAYSDLLGVAGPVQRYLRATFEWTSRDYWFPDIHSLSGATLLLSMVLYPYVYLAARTAFLDQSVCALEVSRTLGLGPWRSFFRVALPLARPSLVAGCSLVIMETIAEFGALQYLAVPTFATGIYRQWGMGELTSAAQLSATLLIFVVFAILLERFSRGRARYHQATIRYR
ncbi:MAG: ABC transporter permease subunit, partial [Planctomycetales bacterium]